MTGPGARRVVIVAGTVFLTTFFIFPARSQTAAGSYEVRRGEGLYAITGKFRYEGVTRFQVGVAIVRANQGVFPEGNVNVLREGQTLRIPGREEAAAIAPAEAAREWQSLTTKSVPPARLAAVKPAPAVQAAIKPAAPAGAPLGRAEAARRYREGQALESKGDDKGALKAYLEAAESGNGLAQKKLGEIYDKGNAAVERDYETSLKWYQKAREQGIEIPKPIVRSPR